MVEHHRDMVGVGGSIPLAPTRFEPLLERLVLVDDIPPSDDDTVDELAAIIARVSNLLEHATSGLGDIADAGEVTKRLRRMERHSEAKELERLMARAEELRSASAKLP